MIEFKGSHFEQGHRQLNSCGPQRTREARLQDHETMAAPVISRHVAIAFAR